MAMVFWRAIFTFFAIYGIVQLLKDLLDYLFFTRQQKNDSVMFVIKVKNSEESLECKVRAILWKCLKLSYGGYIPEILIVDMGSDDNTALIAQKLCDDYSFIYYTTQQLYEEAKKNFEDEQ